MNLTPLLEAPIAIQIHVATVLPAAILGAWIFAKRKGTRIHRLLGKVWLGLMVVSAISSFFIHSINMFYGFSPIHLVSIFVIVSAWLAIRAAQRHDVVAHRRQVQGMYLGGIVGAGAFTLLPGRIMNEVVFTFPESWPDPLRLAFFVAVMVGMVLTLTLAAKLSASRRT